MNSTPQGGITGFQAGCIMWQFIRHWMHIEGPVRLMQYEDMLYPQYEEKFRTIDANTWEELQKQARKKIEEHPDAHADVLAHWKKVAQGSIPFGYSIAA
jgi:hypothetical protein